MQLKQYDEAILALNSVIQLAPSKTNYQELKRIAIKNKSNTLAWQSICQTTSAKNVLPNIFKASFFSFFSHISSSSFFFRTYFVFKMKKNTNRRTKTKKDALKILDDAHLLSFTNVS